MKALVTGAGGRLGRVLALRLAERGHDVAVHFNGSSWGAEETAAAIRALGRQSVTLQADLLDAEACTALVPRAADALGGPLTVLVNNASVFHRDGLPSATAEGFRRHVDVHGLAPLLLTQAFAAQAPGPDGLPLVVNMVDAGILDPGPDFFTYTLSKSLLLTMTRTAALALAPGVRVNALAPGPTLPAPRQRPAHFEALRAKTPLGHGSDPEDIAQALDYLLGAKAVTGVVLPVDGGQHLTDQSQDPLAPG
jgi:NAD(P)-dependent dehydrogenase (short-subunit alcohol dehydrogenase family)